MKANRVEKKLRITHDNAIRYQVITYCFINSIPCTEKDRECIMLLAKTGEHEIASFCNSCVSSKIYSSSQSARNAISKMSVKNLITKMGRKSKKKIKVNPELGIHVEGNLLLEFKMFALETTEM